MIDPNFRQYHASLAAYADTVTGVFQNNFPAAGFDEEQAHALLAISLAQQLRATLNRVNHGIAYRGGAPIDIVTKITGQSRFASSYGVTLETAQSMAEDFVQVALSVIAEPLNAQLEAVAGSGGTYFAPPDTFLSDWEIGDYSGYWQQYYARAQQIAAAEQSVLNAGAPANLVFFGVADEIMRRLDDVKVALDYLLTKDGLFGDLFTRQNMVTALAGQSFGSYVSLFGVDHDTAVEFSTAFCAVMLDAIEIALNNLESSRAQYGASVDAANAQAAQDATQAPLAEEQENAANLAAVEAGAVALMSQLGAIFGERATFQLSDRPGEAFHRFQVAFDVDKFDVTVFIPSCEWIWPATQGPALNNIVAGETWQQFEARIPKSWNTAIGTYPVVASVARA